MMKSLTYFDRSAGRDRIKRRYVWAFWFFVVGILIGTTAGHLM
jgi:hypothetical protein